MSSCKLNDVNLVRNCLGPRRAVTLALNAQAVSSYEHIVFLVDAGRGMLAKAGVKNVEVRCPYNLFYRRRTCWLRASCDLRAECQTKLHVLQGFTPDDTFMDLALKSMEELMKHHIISNPKNSMAVSFYGTVSQRTS